MFAFLRKSPAVGENGAPLFDAITARARRPHWYVEGKVPDTLDGRFAVLATITALVLVRLENEAGDGRSLAVSLTERFIAIMEAEHRELGLGDPTLGKQVRKLVGSLARRTEIWTAATKSERDWNEAAQESLYVDGTDAEALRHSAAALRQLWGDVGQLPLSSFKKGAL